MDEDIYSRFKTMMRMDSKINETMFIYMTELDKLSLLYSDIFNDYSEKSLDNIKFLMNFKHEVNSFIYLNITHYLAEHLTNTHISI